MLKLKNISKVYKTGNFEQKALDEVTLELKKGEFVSILGASGSGKTTLLNIIGGLDQYTSGDLKINGKSTKKFKEKDWDVYRNHSIGFIFQSYNLISHISVLDNVEMALILSGISKSKRKEISKKLLKKVGLKDHIYKRPNQLSGGQKQRVAIARALANNPDVILADEPTGSLDSNTSEEIMDLIREVGENKLVIMVTHNKKIAEKYSSRIVNLKDGHIEKDSAPKEIENNNKNYTPKKTSMNFITALKLSFNNLRTKIKRTIITAFAGSIGIIGISLVLSLSNGMSKEIAFLETDQLSGMPLVITESPMVINMGPKEIEEESNNNGIIPYNPILSDEMHRNYLSDEYVEYINNIDNNLYDAIQYDFGFKFNLFIKSKNEVITEINQENERFVFNELSESKDIVEEQYKFLEGYYPEDYNEVLLVTERNNKLDEYIISSLGIELSKNIEYEKLINKEIVVANNNEYYEYNKNSKLYQKNSKYNEIYDNGIKLKIVGIVRPKENNSEGDEFSSLTNVLNSGIWYRSELTDKILEKSLNSDIVKKQIEEKNNVITGFPFNEYTTKTDFLKKLGGLKIPTGIYIYSKNYEFKLKIKEYLDKWNEGLDEEEKVIYTDFSQQITDTMKTMITMIELVLVAFAAISLVVSSIMIGIITYVSVLERTKEIGILRSLGASKKDIKRVFNAETTIVGFVAGTLGIILSIVISFPANKLLYNLIEVENIVSVNLIQSLFLILISVILTIFAGFIPASIAARKNPVESLRTE